MPIENAVIEPFRGRGPRLPPLAVMAAMGDDMKALLFRLSLDADKGHALVMSRVHSSGGGAHDYALAGPFIGAPQAVMLMELLIVRGARRILFCGLCGSISPDITVGDIIVPTAAFVDEGASLHYDNTAGSSAPAPGLSDALAALLRASGTEIHRGPVWTTDAFFRETPSKVRRFQEQQALAVDMEASALFTVGSFRNTSVAAALVVSDELADYTWRPGFGTPRLREGRRKVWEAIVRLCRNP